MNNAVKHHLGLDIAQQERLTGGYTFETWLLTLSDGGRVVFRTQCDFFTGGGRKIVITDVLAREQFFYDSVNAKLGTVCPVVHVVDGSRAHYEHAFCIMEYIEGVPLDRCFVGLDQTEQNRVLEQIGVLAAQINSIDIDADHPYCRTRGVWEEYVADRLGERLLPLVPNGVVTQDEIDAMKNSLRGKKAVRTRSFLHLDMRRVNMLYNKGHLALLDAENCEFGDPLFELATIDVAGELAPPLLAGYKKAYGGTIDLEDDLYDYYKMERAALVLQLFINELKTEPASTSRYLALFKEVKAKLLKG